jgi:hypothetical protein
MISPKAQRRIDDAEEAARHLDRTNETRLAALVRALIKSHKTALKRGNEE